MVDDAIFRAMDVPRELFRVHGVAEFVPREGFMKKSPGILDVMTRTRRDGPPNRRMDYSGSPGSYSSSQGPGLGTL
jgi:hypothetical protein